MFSRQVILGDTLDTDNIRATYNSGVLRLNIPVAEKAKPRKIAIDVQAEDRHQEAIDARSEDRQAVSA
jgi:HSP20 family protein